MSTKFDGVTAMEPASTKMSGASSSSAAVTSSPKVSMFAPKSGFVIPKNKLAGSLVPRLRANRKLGSDESVNEENAKPGLRTTKWGPDLTQDAAVRKGRALAYQTRVDQLVQQLKSRVSEFGENLDSPSTTTQAEDKSSSQVIDREKSKLLDLEKREAIGEILKLNHSYKAPPDYKPLLKEDKVHVPFKEYPGYNFIGLIFGPGGDNRKRLEKETGTKIQVLGIRKGTKDKGEFIQSNGNDLHNSYEEIYVHVTAETFDKVDAAVSVIEPLITSISGNLATASAIDLSSDLAPGRQGEQNFVASLQPPQQGQSQFGSPWFVDNPSLPGPLNANSSNPGVIPSSNPLPPSNLVNQSFSNYNPSNTTSFGPQTIVTSLFDSIPLNPPIVSPGIPMRSPSQLLHNAAMTRPSPFGGLVPNPSPLFPPHPSVMPISSASPFPGGQPLQPPPAAIAGTGMPSLPQALPNAPQGPIPERPFIQANSIRSGGPMNMMQVGPRMGPPPQPANLLPAPSPQFTLQNPIGARLNQPSVPPIISQSGGPRQSHPSMSDFTFQPNRPPSSQGFVQPGPPHAGSFRPPILATRPFPQAFPRPPMGNQMPQPMSFPPRHHQFQVPPNAFPTSVDRGFNPAPPLRPLGPFPNRPSNAREDLFNFHGHIGQPPSQQFGHPDPIFSGRPALGPGRPQFYDPFSPTSANNLMKQHKGANSGGGRRQENDPEYEDLMASVGVK